jgi:2'-5' RNA ligase
VSADLIRAFVALELPGVVRARLAEVQARLRPRLPGLRWVAADSLHLTLRFLGDATPGELVTLARDVGAAAAACPRAIVRLTGLGVFPERGAPRTLWVGVDLPAAFLELQRACEIAARSAGFEPERRPFTPHLTLGRWRERVPEPRLDPCELGEAALERLIVFRSELRPDGARHTPLHVFELPGERGPA